MLAALARWLGIDPRGWLALTRVLILMDLRGQHFASATASQPGQPIGPLFLVVGQCLTLSTLAALFLFARVDVFFFALVTLSLGLAVLCTTLLVEFPEAVLNQRDLEILGCRPLSPATYAAARLANLGFYVLLMYLSLNLFPLVVGVGLRDAGPGFFPAYLLASLTGALVLTAVVVLIVSLGHVSARLEALRTVLAWVQILLILVIFYGGQLMLRDRGSALLLWGAFPPAWIEYLPSTWLARFVARAAGPEGVAWWEPLVLIATALLSTGLLLARVTYLYRHLHPETPLAIRRPMPATFQGGLRGAWGSFLVPTPDQRVGFWLAQTLLRRDADFFLRAALAFALPATLLGLGIALNQFPDPWVESAPERIALPLAVVYLMPLAMPALVHNLTYCRDHAGAWVFRGLAQRPEEIATGALTAAFLLLVFPIAIVFAFIAEYLWLDLAAVLAHAVLVLVLCALAAWASLWLVPVDLPFSRPPQAGGTTGVNPIPLLAIGAVATLLDGLHLFLGHYWQFWLGLGIAAVPAYVWLRRRALAHLAQIARPT